MEEVLPLAGRQIVVTRPAGQSTHLAQALRALGATPVLFPALEILPLTDLCALRTTLERLDSYDWAVFVSANAIECALPLILSHRPWPTSLQVATMGKSSEQALRAHGLNVVLSPQDRFDSESLLALAPWQTLNGARMVIFRGETGRDMLGDALRQRGAHVDYCPCYRRRMPQTSPTPLLDRWRNGKIDALTLTSSEGLHNLYQMVGKLGQAWMRKTPVFVTHARIQEAAQKLNLLQIVPTGPGDAGLIAGLISFFGSLTEGFVRDAQQ
jgi:uroporphyrinogen-III synthase